MTRALVRTQDAPAAGWVRADQYEGLSLLPPVSGTVFGAALNTRSALDALGDQVQAAPYKAPPQAPILYIKTPNTYRPHHGVVPVAADIEALSVGATLAVVFGRAAARVSEAAALDHVLGYAVAIDIAIPHASVYRPAIRQQCSDGFLPIGPGIVERSAIANPDQLDVAVEVNGDLVFRWSTAELIRPIARLIADISDFMTFAAGDALLVGIPADCPLARVGDRVAATIGGVGRLECTLETEAPTEWLA